MGKGLRRIMLGVLLIGLLIALAACSGDNEESASGSQDDNGNDSGNDNGSSEGDLSGDVTMWTASLAGDPFDSYFDDIKKDFEELHPDVNVNIEDIPQEEIEQKVLTSLTGSDVPDLVNLAPRFVFNIAAQGGLLDLSDKIDDDTKDSYLEGPFEAGYFDDGLYALPWYLTTTVSWYNNNHFEEAGIDSTPDTTQGIYDTAKAITDATGNPSFYQVINEGETVIDKMITLANGDPIVENGEAKITDKDEILEYFTLTQKMYDEGIIPQENAEGSFTTAQELYMAENISMLETGVTFLGPIEEGAPDVYEATKASQPLNDEDAPVNVAIMNFSIPSKTDNPDAAMALAEFVTNAENQLEFAEIAGTVLPSTKESLKDDYFQDPGDSPKALGMLEASESLERSESLMPPLENNPKLREIVKMTFVENLQGKLTPEEALQKIEDGWNESFEKEGITEVTF